MHKLHKQLANTLHCICYIMEPFEKRKTYYVRKFIVKNY